MQADPPWLRRGGPGLLLDVHAQPGARRSAIVGEHGGRLKIALRAPPVDGRANEELVACLAGHLALPRSSISLVSGAGSRTKRVAIACDPAAVERIARQLCPPNAD